MDGFRPAPFMPPGIALAAGAPADSASTPTDSATAIAPRMRNLIIASPRLSASTGRSAPVNDGAPMAVKAGFFLCCPPGQLLGITDRATGWMGRRETRTRNQGTSEARSRNGEPQGTRESHSQHHLPLYWPSIYLCAGAVRAGRTRVLTSAAAH